MDTTADRAVQCAECGGVIRKGQKVEVMRSADDTQWLRIHTPDCPKERDVRPVNQPQRIDAGLMYWERYCLRCKTTHTGKIGSPIPARCDVRVYSANDERCGGEWVDPEVYIAETTEDERPEWVEAMWGRHGGRPTEERVPEGQEANIFRDALKDLHPVAGPDDDIPF